MRSRGVIAHSVACLLMICSVCSSKAGWDKPFKRGGPLSVNKPFNKGGGLSINKVDVPSKLRIGRVQSLTEVIIPLCWGSPQDCRGTPDIEESNRAARRQTSYPFYVIGRFTCTERSTGMRSGKSCDVVKNSSISCAHALQSLNDHPSTHGDPCTYCSENEVDSTTYWDGLAPNHVQGGPCSGM